MKEYLVCGCFFLIFTMLLYALGKAVDIKEESYSVKFIKGYLVYSFFVAIGGMSVQLLHLKYRIFFAYMSVVLLLAVLKIIYSIKQENYIKIVTLKNFVKCNWFLIVLTIILCYMMFYYYRAFWYGNHLDDGYYLTKIATIASGCENNIDNIPVGVGKGLGITYLLNTWEIESAFYIKMLHVTPSLYIRLFQSGFNYYLFFNCVLAFGDRIARAVKKDYNKKALQYVCGTCLLFFVYYVYMQDTKLLFLRDTFTLNTAMYFGSSIVKMIAFMCLLMFYLEDEKITWKMVLGVFGISVVMISKSTIVLPTLFVTGVSYVIVTLLFTKEWKQKIIGIILAAFIVLAGIILPNNQVAQKEVYQYVFNALKSPFVIGALAVFGCSFFARKRVIYKINTMVILMGLLFAIPQLNDISEFLAVYGFVAGRAWSTYVYTFLIINLWYVYLFMSKILNETCVKIIFIAITCGMVRLLFYGYETDGKELFVTDNMKAKTNLEEDFDVLYRNHKFEPDTSIELGKELERIGKEKKKKLFVVSPEWALVDNTIYTLSVQLRSVAPDVVSVSAVNRYEVDRQCQLYGYDQEIYEKFVNEPSDESSRKLSKQVKKYNINCIIVQNKDCENYLDKIGFKQEAVIQGGVYYVWYKSAR